MSRRTSRHSENCVMIVVSDTSPITNLISVGQVDLLREIFAKVIIPPAVYEEICQVPDNRNVLLGLDWIETVALRNTKQRDDLLAVLDPGEAEAIALAIEIEAKYILIDELTGRNTAELIGLRIIGVLGVLIEAKHLGLVGRIQPIIESLVKDARFHLSSSLIDRTLRSVGEL